MTCIECSRPASVRRRWSTHYERWRRTPEGRRVIKQKIPESELIGIPEPMPARDARGERVWLHYRPLRWERHA